MFCACPETKEHVLKQGKPQKQILKGHAQGIPNVQVWTQQIPKNNKTKKGHIFNLRPDMIHTNTFNICRVDWKVKTCFRMACPRYATCGTCTRKVQSKASNTCMVWSLKQEKVPKLHVQYILLVASEARNSGMACLVPRADLETSYISKLHVQHVLQVPASPRDALCLLGKQTELTRPCM